MPDLRRIARLGAATVGAVGALAAVASAATSTGHAGPGGDGTAITPLGYRVTPAGTQTALGDLPLGLALSPDGSMLLATNNGQGVQSLQVVDAATSQVTQTIRYRSPKSLFAGLAFSPDGTTAYASGGGDELVHTYSVADGALTEGVPIALPLTNPAGMKVNLYPAGLAATPDGSALVVADHLGDAASVVDLATDTVSTVAVGHAPYAVAVSADSTTAYVSNQGGNTVSVLDLTSGAPTVRATLTVGTHPNALLLHDATLYVADGDSDEVSVVDVTSDTVTRTIDLAPYVGAQVGSNPTGLALSSDDATLYVTNSGNNDVAVVDTATGTVQGLIPTGWYPSAIVSTPTKLYVANAKGLGAGPNNGPGHPDPTSITPTDRSQYVGSMMVGTLSTVALPVPADQLSTWTQTVGTNDGFANADSSSPSQPIKHVIFVVQENRTYDQVFGSLGKGNGDPSLNLFGDESAPNQRALQRQFVTLDNFYADAEVSAQGWNWTVAANSNSYSESLWPADYSDRHAPYPSDGVDPATAPNRDPANAYIWDRLAEAGVSFRNYGFYVSRTNDSQMVAADPVLDENTDHNYLGFDLHCPDNPDTFLPRAAYCTPRITEWQNEFDQYVRNGNLPTVEFVRLPNDHTAGTDPGMPTPQAYVADNDLALGRLVDSVSHSRYWHDTVILVTEDDAQNGPDHVDAHRTISQVVSPWSQTGAVDSTFYSTASMLRTIENIVGVRPMTQFDTYSTPMTAAFTAHPDDRPYLAVVPEMAGDTTNGVDAPMASISAAQQLDREDQINMRLFNEAIWQSVKGAESKMPAPEHSLWGAVSVPDDAKQ